jgi:hypothetical protein
VLASVHAREYAGDVSDADMSRPTSARIAGFAFLLYIAAGMTSLRGAPGPLLEVVLSFIMCFSALTLGVTLFGVTSGVDRDIARMGMVCRVAEGIVGIMFMSLSLAMRSASPAAVDATTLQALKTLLSAAERVNFSVAGMLFSVGSTMFCWLLMRGRLIPVGLAWIGFFASVLLVVVLPLRLGDVLSGRYTMLVWIPMAAFEIPAGLWMLLKGVRQGNHQSPITDHESLTPDRESPIEGQESRIKTS